MAGATDQESSEFKSAHVYDYYGMNNTGIANFKICSHTWFSSFLLVTYRSVVLSVANSASISALTIAGSVFGTCAIEAQVLIGEYFLPFSNALDVITVNCLMLFATKTKTHPWARPRPFSGFLLFGKKCSGLMSTEF